MTTEDVKALAGERYVDGIHEKPDPQRASESFWTSSNKHKRRTERDLDLLELYVRVVLATGSKFDPCGIRLGDGKYLVPDRAVMNSAINAGLIALDEKTHCFRMPRKAWASIRLEDPVA